MRYIRPEATVSPENSVVLRKNSVRPASQLDVTFLNRLNRNFVSLVTRC